MRRPRRASLSIASRSRWTVLHREVDAEITINVARSLEEAELQASGKSIQDLAAEADAEAEFDIAELFDEVGAAALDEDDMIVPGTEDESGTSGDAPSGDDERA